MYAVYDNMTLFIIFSVEYMQSFRCDCVITLSLRHTAFTYMYISAYEIYDFSWKKVKSICEILKDEY